MEKTLTFTVEDALISPMGLAVLTGAGLIKNEGETVHFHMTSIALCDNEGNIDLSDAAAGEICADAPLFVMEVDKDNSLTGKIFDIESIEDNKLTKVTYTPDGPGAVAEDIKNKTVMVDYYVIKDASKVSEVQIDAENFAGYYYVEADTFFRKQIDGVDAPVNITIPNVKIQSNFSFSMAPSGDPTTFTFTMDAMPGYTYFNNKKKVLCVMQIVEDAEGSEAKWESVMAHEESETINLEKDEDSYIVKPVIGD